MKRNFFNFVLFAVGYYDEPMPVKSVPADFSYPNPDVALNEGLPQVQWVNHSTFLIKVGGKVLLTDPIWAKRCSPFSFIGPKRHFVAPFSLDELTQVDYVLISHNHYDHLDKKTCKNIFKKFPDLTFLVPWGVKKWFQKRLPSLKKVVELQWGESFSEGGFAFTAVPAQHFSGRSPFDTNRTGWQGYVVDVPHLKKRLYFAGDTGYNAHDFKEIGRKYAPFDLSLIPIGAYLPRAFMAPVHVCPAQAVKIHQEVGSKLSVGGHFGTFRLSKEPLHQPPYDLYQALLQENSSWQQFRVLKPGQSLNW